MFVGEAPGAEEDRQGLPFVGRSGALLSRLLEEAGLSREDVFIANTLKCRPPENRNPTATEIETCQPWLLEQIRLIEPRVVATLGNFATRLLSGQQTGISRIHGVPQIHTLGQRTVYLYPLFHPAAALRATGTTDLLRKDLAALPELLARDMPEPPGEGQTL
jgi:DNA polymerase